MSDRFGQSAQKPGTLVKTLTFTARPAHFLKDFIRKAEMEIKKERLESMAGRVTDMTSQGKHGFATEKNYRSPHEVALAQYALTSLISQCGTFARDMKNVAQEPTKDTIETDTGKSSLVYCDVMSHVSVPSGDAEAYNGIVQAIWIPSDKTYRVSLSGDSQQAVQVLEDMYEQLLESSNFYQGKALRFAKTGVTFVKTPTETLSDAILPPKTLHEYEMNVISFLTNPEMYAITKKRAILLHGPPGTGKTTSVQALFNALRQKEVSCIFISDESFTNFSVEEVFDFINKYLAPALVVFEDIDLIATDRKVQTSRIIGPLLSALNGVQNQEKPIAIIGTTNRPEIMDAAVTRPCRFDRKIKVDFPTEEALKIMFQRRAGFDPPPGAIKQGSGKDAKLTGAHIEEIYNTAALLSVMRKVDIKDCVEEAVETVRENFFMAHPGITGFNDDEGEEYPQDEAAEGCCPSSIGDHPDDGDFFKGS